MLYLTVVLLLTFATGWELIIQQDIHAEHKVFDVSTKTTLLENENNSLLFPFMKVGNIDWNNIPYPYEFIIIWVGSNLGGGLYNNAVKWTQTSILSTDVHLSTDYICTNSDQATCPATGSDSGFHGLQYDSITDKCIFDGDGTRSGLWFNCPSALTDEHGAIPGPNTKWADGAHVFIQNHHGIDLEAERLEDIAAGIVLEAEEDLASHWTKIAQQDTSAAFSTDSSSSFLENEHDPDAYPFMNIGNIDWGEVPYPYHFLIQWSSEGQDHPIDHWFEWTQNSELSASVGMADGYECVAGLCPLTSFGGLGFNGLSLSASPEKCMFDGDGSSEDPNNWFNCVGAKEFSGGGIPGPDGHMWAGIKLYLDTGVSPTAAPTAAPTATVFPSMGASNATATSEFEGSSANSDVMETADFLMWSIASKVNPLFLSLILLCWYMH